MKKFKLFFAWQHREEEAWLNDMAEKGYRLVSVTYPYYHFEEEKEKEWVYRLASFGVGEEVQDQIEFYESCGFDHVGKCVMWHYFEGEKSDLISNELFSDSESEMDMLIKYRNVMGAIMIFNGFNFFNLYRNRLAYFFVLSLILLVFLLLAYGVFKLNRRIKELREMSV